LLVAAAVQIILLMELLVVLEGVVLVRLAVEQVQVELLRLNKETLGVLEQYMVLWEQEEAEVVLVVLVVLVVVKLLPELEEVDQVILSVVHP
jgi:uncharacterized protein YigA (DUF484 family)